MADKKQPTADELMNMGGLQRFGEMVKGGFGIAKRKLMGEKDEPWPMPNDLSKPTRMPVKTKTTMALKKSLDKNRPKRNSKEY